MRKVLLEILGNFCYYTTIITFTLCLIIVCIFGAVFITSLACNTSYWFILLYLPYSGLLVTIIHYLFETKTEILQCKLRKFFNWGAKIDS